MAADPILIIATQTRLAPARGQAGPIRSAMADYWALTKPEVNLLIAIATFAGFYLACPRPLDDFPWLLLVKTILGTIIVDWRVVVEGERTYMDVKMTQSVYV